ncbi:MAG: hypothetical protein KF831_06945 [Acidobacteria bacterium]|nr:hypothetical protein [Acidobacteriota bacterium]
MPFTHFLANELIDYIRSNYTSVWIGLFTADPNKNGGGTEVAGGSYARVEMDTDDVFPAAANSETANDSIVSFPTATASWGAITSIGLWDASSAGNLLTWHELPTPRPVGNGDNMAFPIGNIIIRNS